jgi:Ran GTPase-activating protein 1
MAEQETYSLKVGGDRMVLVDAAEAERITGNWREVRAENEAEGAVLTEVNLGCRKYTLEGVTVFQDFLTPEFVSQVTVFIGDDMISSIPADEALLILNVICSIFAGSPLQEVNLSNNALGNRGLTACDAVLGQQAGLKKLSLENNGLSMESMEVLLEQLRDSTTLEALFIYHNMIGPEGAVVFAHLLRTLPNLRELRYAQNRAGTKGVRAILQALVENQAISLEKLDIEGGKLFSRDEEDGIEPLCALLRRSPNLYELNIGDSDLTDEGMVPVAQAIVDGGAALEELIVKENDLTAVSCEALVPVLASNVDHLRAFTAETNEFKSTGVQTLMAAYTRSAILQRLDLIENELGHIAAVALANAPLPHLVELKVDKNGFPIQDVTRLKQRFGDALVEMKNNDEDAEFDADREELEEQLEAVNDAPRQDEEEEDQGGFDPLDMLSQALNRQHVG